MACCIEYRSNGSGSVPPSGTRPNSSRVLAFGVAVNAKYEMFGAWAVTDMAHCR